MTDTVTPWHDTARTAAERVESIVEAMTLDEKIAQLYGVWVGASAEGGEVAPHQHDMEMDEVVDLDTLLPLGLGQLTRPFGTRPVDPALGAVSLMRSQQRIVAEGRFGIPAIAHEECLAGFAAWGATAYPVPLGWGATFDPTLIERMAHRIGSDMRSVGIHQGLAPVLDVVRDARWGRVEETMGEDPYLVATIGTAYVRGLESAGIVATLKHFVGYSASIAGRNLAPVSVGRRERSDVLLAPFEMALREGGARSVMNAYTDIDGVPSAADADLLTGILREQWGFAGTVVADYFAIAFLMSLHGVAGSLGDAAAQALRAGIDVELPTVRAFGAPLLAAVADGSLDVAVIDRALRRVLLQKLELGLLDADWTAVPPALVGRNPADSLRGSVDLDPPQNRELARAVAEQSIVLLSNDGMLPLAKPARIAVLGPTATDPFAVLGCYSFPTHIGVKHPDVPVGIRLPTLLEALADEFPAAEIVHAQGTTIDGGDMEGIPAAVALAVSADVVIMALGDRAGMFGRGTSGEGCDAESLALPGAQQQLLDAVLETGTPTALALLAGRPYALGAAPSSAGAIIQAFFAGEEGTGAIAGVLSGRVNPSGRLPVSVPAHPGAQPSTYLAARLGKQNAASGIDPTPAFPFGHGIGFCRFDWTDCTVSSREVGTDGEVELALTVTNAGDRDGAEIVQLYLHDPVASVVRPMQRLVGFTRLELSAGESRRVRFTVPADLTWFTLRDETRVVDPGEIVLGFGRSSGDIPLTHAVMLTGPRRVVDHTRRLHARVDVVG